MKTEQELQDEFSSLIVQVDKLYASKGCVVCKNDINTVHNRWDYVVVTTLHRLKKCHLSDIINCFNDNMGYKNNILIFRESISWHILKGRLCKGCWVINEQVYV